MSDNYIIIEVDTQENTVEIYGEYIGDDMVKKIYKIDGAYTIGKNTLYHLNLKEIKKI